jgi:two-component system chemotaxis response regulator CheY
VRGINVCGHEALALGDKSETIVESPTMERSRNLVEQAEQSAQAASPVFRQGITEIRSFTSMIEEKIPLGLKEDGTPYRVLVADDSLFIAKQLGQIFTSEKFEIVATATNGAQAVESYKELSPDLITLDITMPVMDGVTALEQIMAYDQNAKVIMASALGKEDVVKKCIQTGAKSYILKPFDRTKVLERVVFVLNH